MIIFGSGSAHVKTEKARNATCGNCKNQGTISFSVFRKHAHIFWIPMFPLHKTGASQCGHCQQVLKPNEMPEPLKREYQTFKTDVKGPIWQFSGLVLLACLIAFAGYSSRKDNDNTISYLARPAKGDIIEYRTETNQFSTMKVIEVMQDSILVSLNSYEIARSSKIHKIDKHENYADDYYTIAKTELQTMHSEGTLLDINRN